MASKFEQIDNEVRALQARREFVSIAVYKIVGEYAERIAAAGKACGQCARVHISSGNIGAVSRTGEPHVCEDVRSDPAYKTCFEGIGAEMIMPVKSTAGKLVGVVDVEAKGDIDAAEIEIFANMPRCSLPRTSVPRGFQIGKAWKIPLLSLRARSARDKSGTASLLAMPSRTDVARRLIRTRESGC